MSTIEYLTVQEVALQLKVSPITIRRYIAQGRLAAVKVGRGVRIRKEAVDSLPEPVKPSGKGRKPKKPRYFTMDDPFWDLLGIIASDPATDVSENKYKYLAEAYAPQE
jgi:excisionase family DNA binding protein